MENNTIRIHRPLKYKFLRRNLKDVESDELIIKIRLKRVYFKDIGDQEVGEKFHYKMKGKQLSCLRALKLETDKKCQTLEIIKSCKGLKHLKLGALYDQPMKDIITCIKRLPKDLEYINLEGPDHDVKLPDIRGVYKALVGFTKLKVLKKFFDFLMNEQGCAEEENVFINKYVSRLKNLKDFGICQTESNELSFQRLMKKDQGCPYVTELSMQMSAEELESYNAVEHMLKEERSDDNNEESKDYANDNDDDDNDGNDENDWVDDRVGEYYEDYENENDQDFQDEGEDAEENGNNYRTEEEKIQAINSEMAPFFKFHLFPNLRKLSLVFTEGALYPLNSSVVEGFKSLQKLECLILKFQCRPIGTKYFFDGLAHLPLLLAFVLDSTFIKGDEFSSLAKFLERQTKLVSLFLRIPKHRRSRGGYQIQNFCLENVWQCLNDKPNLKYLTLKSVHWAIESLSKGLGKTNLLGQLQSLEIETFDDNVTSSSSSEDRVKGLCDFLVRHKTSLHTLKMTLWNLADDIFTDHIIKAMMELENLKILLLKVNGGMRTEYVRYKKFFKKVFSLEASAPQKNLPRFQNTIHELGTMLRRLNKLSELKMEVNPLGKPKLDSKFNCSAIINSLPSVKGLKDVTLRLPFSKEDLDKNPNQMAILFELQNVTSLEVYQTEGNIINILDKVTDKINHNQNLRCDLMF